MKNFLENLIDEIKTPVTVLFLAAALCLTAKADNAPFTFTTPNAGTNASAGLVTNATVQICKVVGAPVGVSSPLPCAIWPSGGGLTAGASTNTFTFANSMDGVTLVNTNYWTVTLACNNGTNVITGYNYVPATNYTGAKGFGLVSVTIGGTNGFTNGSVVVSWPY